eukprot:SM000074S21677  [mRNA]  locus=s74:317687:324258:- [translate_table: standard]
MLQHMATPVKNAVRDALKGSGLDKTLPGVAEAADGDGDGGDGAAKGRPHASPMLRALQSCVSRVADDDILIEDEALLMEDFLEVLRESNGPEVAQKVEQCYSLSTDYNTTGSPEGLQKLEEMFDQMEPEDSIVLASAFSHMLNLGNLAEEVQMAHRKRATVKTGEMFDEASAITESNITETFMKLKSFGKTKHDIFEAIKSQTVDLVFTAHPTQSVRRSLLQKHARIRGILTELHDGSVSADKRTELLEALKREIQAAWRTDEIRRAQPTPQDEMRAGMSYFHETIWKGLPVFLRRIDTALKHIGINERLPYNAPVIQFTSWMGGDRDGNPRVTPEVTRDVCLLSRLMSANLFLNQIEDLMFELSMWRCSDELRARVEELAGQKKEVKHYIEFWKAIPSSEPYRVILGHIRDKLWNTRERAQHLLQENKSLVPVTETFTSVEQLLEPLEMCYRSLCSTGDQAIADGTLLDYMRQVSCFGLALVKLDIRQESDRHTEVVDAITKHLGLGSYKDKSEDERISWLVSELTSKRPLFGADLPTNEDIRDVLNTIKVVADLPSDSFAAYVISMATSTSDVLAVELLQRACGVKTPMRVVPLFEKLADLENAPQSIDKLFSIPWYKDHIKGKQEVMIGYSDSGKDAGRLSAAWAMFKAQEDLVKIAKKHDVKLTMFHGRGGTVGRGGGPTHLAILSQPPETVNGALRVTVQGEVIEHSFGEQNLCFRTLQRFTAATLEHGMHPPASPHPKWRTLMDKMCVEATKEYRSIVFKDPRFVEYFRSATPEQEYGRLNIGSRPSKRKPGGGVESLRAIPWIFAWTQTRFHLPVWLGIGGAIKTALEEDPENMDILQEMYARWPFFRVTIDLIEMVFAKGDPRIAEMYDRLLVKDELRSFGKELQKKYAETQAYILQIAGHTTILDTYQSLKQRLAVREPYITPLNVQQAYMLKKMRAIDLSKDAGTAVPASPSSANGTPKKTSKHADVINLNMMTEYTPGLEDSLIITMKGIAAGMQNTG